MRNELGLYNKYHETYAGGSADNPYSIYALDRTVDTARIHYHIDSQKQD